MEQRQSNDNCMACPYRTTECPVMPYSNYDCSHAQDAYNRGYDLY